MIAIYRLPKQKKCTFVKGTAEALSSVRDIYGEGFVIAPFAIDAETPLLIVRPDQIAVYDDCRSIDKVAADAIDACCNANALTNAPDKADRDDYARDFANCIDKLSDGSFRKIVLARCAQTDKLPDASCFEMFSKACDEYPRAFVALFSTPQSGTWLVATPEILLEKQPGRWHTMALAGTMKLSGEDLAYDIPVGSADNDASQPRWSLKNRHEQLLVAAFVSTVLSCHTDHVVQTNPATVRAANLVHLRSDFYFDLRQKSMAPLLDDLHPTPAVCGIPKNEAKDFIINNEHTPRLYYSGFCGPLGIDDETHLYVSLRCMRIDRDRCLMFAGGGLLPESDINAEWDETVAKMETMLKVKGKG